MKSKKFLSSESNQKLRSTPPGYSLSFEPTMKKIHEMVQALESDIGFWWPSWILLKKLKKHTQKTTGKFPRAPMHTANIWK